MVAAPVRAPKKAGDAADYRLPKVYRHRQTKELMIPKGAKTPWEEMCDRLRRRYPPLP